MAHPFLQPSPYETDGGHMIGRDPRTISEAEWLEHMPATISWPKMVRAKCLECAHTANEVRKCVCHACPLWPFRMGGKPRNLRNTHGSGSESASEVSDQPETESERQTPVYGQFRPENGI